MNKVEAVVDLLFDYVTYIDDDRLEEWIDFFLEESIYQVVPRENLEQDLPASLILCVNKNMLRDRVAALRNANKYNLHYVRHIVSAPQVRPTGEDRYRLTAAYSVFQTTLEGESRIFSLGRYQDEIRFIDGRPFFEKKLVVVDTFNVPSLLAVPL